MSKQLKTILIAVPATLMSISALAQNPEGPRDYWHPAWGWGWGHTAFGSLMMLLFWGGIILIVVLAVRWSSTGSSPGATPQLPRKTAMEILQERFAKGEIDKEEFEERKRLLSD